MYVRTNGDGCLISRPPVEMSPDGARKYLAVLRRELAGVLGPSPYASRRKVDLEDGRRGGYFADANVAIDTLLWETVDSARSSKAKSVAPGEA